MTDTPVSRPISYRRKLLTTWLLLMAGVLPGFGDVSLLTGDANNQIYNSAAAICDLSADGDLVLFSTSPPPANGPPAPGITKAGLYERRISTNTLTYVDDPAHPSNIGSTFSDDGRYIAWLSVDNFIYWHDVQTKVTRLITPAADAACARPVISADGRYVAYYSLARNLVSNPAKLQAAGRGGVYLYDSVAKTTTVISLTSTGKALDTGIGSSSQPTAAGEFDFSADGKFLVFSSDATNVHPDRPSNYPAGLLIAYRRNLATGAVDILNKTASGSLADGNFTTPRCSADGGRVVFYGGYVGTFAGVRLIDSVVNSVGIEVYVKEPATGNLWWASKTTDGSISDGYYNLVITISGNGTTVAFGSSGTKYVIENTDPPIGNNGSMDVFRVDLGTNGKVTTKLVTTSPNGSGNVDFTQGPFLPGNGAYVAFCSYQAAALFGTGSADTPTQGFAVSFPKGPEIDIQQPYGSSLVDGTAKKSFGSVKVGASSTAKTFTIKNPGTTKLTGLALTLTGTQKADFVISTALGKTSLLPGGSTTFKITFKPSALKTRKAILHVASNDANENPFDINLTGLGVP